MPGFLQKSTIKRAKRLEDTIPKAKLEALAKEAEKIPSLPQLARVLGVDYRRFYKSLESNLIIQNTILDAEAKIWHKRRTEYEQVSKAYMTGEPIIVNLPRDRKKEVFVNKFIASAAAHYWGSFQDLFFKWSLTQKLNKYYDMVQEEGIKNRTLDNEGKGLTELRKHIIGTLDGQTGVNDRLSEEDLSFRPEHLKAIDVNVVEK